jgi:polar amino acid transport system substrate-binding protein
MIPKWLFTAVIVGTVTAATGSPFALVAGLGDRAGEWAISSCTPQFASQPLTTAATPMPSQTLDTIRKKGVLTVGVKTDFPPFGMLNAAGEPEGFEIDLAAEIAKRLGVGLSVLTITTENRFQKLEQGDIDIMIATSADTQERRQIATAIEPNYYAGGVTVFLRPDQRITEWQAMRGQKVCATQGAYFNRPMAQRHLLDLQMYRNTRDALLALHDGRCMGFLYSTAAVQAYLKDPQWANYHAPLPAAMAAPWAINVSRKEHGSALEQLLGDMLAQWHQSGYLVNREAAWGIQPTQFLAAMHSQWSRLDASGQPVCKRAADGQWPAACRNPAFVRSTEVDGLRKWGLWMQESTGLNLTFVYDPYDRHVFLKGVLYTLALMVCCVFLSLVLGALASIVVDSRWRWPGRIVRGLATYLRMTPPLLQMYVIFFGVCGLLWNHFGLGVSAFWVAVACLSSYTAASVMSTLLESAQHMRLAQPKFKLTLKQMAYVVEYSASPIKAALINVVKQSVMASALAVPELLSATTSIMSDQGNVTVMMNVFLLSFVLLITLWMRLLNWLERKVHALQASTP